jgi:hypothetical protein
MVSGALLLCFMRGHRAVRLRHDPNMPSSIPPRTGTICLLITVLASMWLVRPYLVRRRRAAQKIFMCVVMAQLVSAGSITLVLLRKRPSFTLPFYHRVHFAHPEAGQRADVRPGDRSIPRVADRQRAQHRPPVHRP